MNTPIKTSIGRPRTHSGSAFILTVLVLAWLAFLPKAQAVVPAPDGGYPGGNTAEGQSALLSLTTGGYNTAVGFLSLRNNTGGSFNTAIGAGALFANVGDPSTFQGVQNTATGAGALLSNTTGTANTANGAFALSFNTTGGANTANGWQALLQNTTGNGNTANGDGALQYNTTGNSNTAIGGAALSSNTTGNGNVAVGVLAGSEVATANNVICIGAGATGANVSNSCYIGGIRNVQTAFADAIPVLIDSHGQLGTTSSSKRFKREVKPMDKASEAILALEPVTFHYKSDKTGTPQFGLIAEEVAQVNPNLVVRDDKGEIYTVRYDAVNAMLLNEFLKEHRKVEEQEAIITQLRQDFQSKLAGQQNQIEALISGLEKVSNQLELSKSAPQIVLNNQ